MSNDDVIQRKRPTPFGYYAEQNVSTEYNLILIPIIDTISVVPGQRSMVLHPALLGHARPGSVFPEPSQVEDNRTQLPG